MPRPRRPNAAGYVSHVLHGSSGGGALFVGEEDFRSFERLLLTAVRLTDMRLLAYCLMPNHWHLVVQPRFDGTLSRFMQSLTQSHAGKTRGEPNTRNRTPAYAPRFKSFLVQPSAEYLFPVINYVERNPVRAELVTQLQDWHWCSFWRWMDQSGALGTIRPFAERISEPLLSPWPVSRPVGWDWYAKQEDRDLDAIRLCVKRSRPYGSDVWTREVADKFGLQSTLRPLGRPRKH